jgi:hypothetical protein
MNQLKKSLLSLIEKAAALGLPAADLDTVKEFYEHHEWGLTLDTIATQLHEQRIAIGQEIYDQLRELAGKMKDSPDQYLYLQELVKK